MHNNISKYRGSGRPRYENMKTRRLRIASKTCKIRRVKNVILLKLVVSFTVNKSQSPQNRYCCVPLCDQKGSIGPNGVKVGFFSIQTERERWLHAMWREPGKHFSVTDSTKVCSIHFKNEHLKKSFGTGRLTYVEGAVPSVFAWERSSLRKRPL